MNHFRMEPMAGDDIHRFALLMCDEACRRKERACALFNDTIIWADPGEIYTHVVKRWSDDRAVFQVARCGRVS